MAQHSEFPDDTAFRQAVSETLDALLEQVDALDSDDLEPNPTAGNLAVNFEDGSVILLSQQTPTHELWLSANYRAWHFLRRGGVWVERDSGEQMTSVLSGLLSEKLGQPVHLAL